MSIFITGGTGFIGRHIIRRLVAGGHEVHALAGNRAADSALRMLGARPVPGHVTDRASLEQAMTGSTLVIHAANTTYAAQTQTTPAADLARIQTHIVTGTQHTLGAALDLGIPRIVFLSSVAVFGNTNGLLVDETYVPPSPPDGPIYRALWHAHYDVAEQLTRQDAPLITLLPGEVFGPGMTGWLANLMRRYHRGTLPAIPAPETTFTYAYVDDVTEGILLAANKGRQGESYCLAGPAIPLGELIEFWALLTGRRAPAVSLSARSLRAVPLVADKFMDEPLQEALGGTYIASADKARHDLGWTTRPMQTTMLETLAWIAASEPTDRWDRQRYTELLALAGLAGVGVAWLVARSRSGASD